MKKTACLTMSLLCLMATATLSSCDDEFSPNAKWRDVPSVYCLLDQDDDTTFVRVQRCYLGDGNLYDYAANPDSTNYPQGSIEVKIYQWDSPDDITTGKSPRSVLDCSYAEIDKDDGAFGSYNGKQPIYYHVNADGDLDDQCCYQLVVTKTSTGEVLAKATTILVSNADPNKGWLTTPFPANAPNPRSKTFNMLTGKCEIKWRTLDNGRLYQPAVRFYYRHRYDPRQLHHLDINCTLRNSVTGAIELSTDVSKEFYLNEIAKALRDDTNHKIFVDTVGISLLVCNEDMKAYIATTADVTTTTMPVVYSNIEGGTGLFGARRCHLFEKVLADDGDTPQGMHTLLENLKVGFEQK